MYLTCGGVASSSTDGTRQGGWARSESSTDPGDVYMSRDTFDRLESRIPSRALPPIKVKNKTKPLELYAVDFEAVGRLAASQGAGVGARTRLDQGQAGEGYSRLASA